MDARTLALGVSVAEGVKNTQALTGALLDTGKASDIVTEATKRVTAATAAAAPVYGRSSDDIFAQSRVLKEEAIDLNSVDARWKALMQTMSGADTTTKQVTDATKASGAAHVEAGAAAEQSTLKLGRLQSGVVSLIGQMGGATQETRLLNGALTAFGAGSNPIALVALGSTAALAAAYEFLTTKTREQKKAQDDATESLKKYNAQQLLGFAGQQGDNLAKAEKKLQDLRDELDNASKAFSGDSAKNAQIVADTQKRYDAQAAIVAAGEKNVANISREAYADNLADLARNNQLKGALYDQAVLLLKGNEKELADLQKQASNSFVVPDTVLQRIRELTDQDKNLYQALYPDPKKVKDAVDVLASARKAMNDYIDEAANFGKQDSIERKTASIISSYDALEKKYPELTATIETFKKSVLASGDTLEKAFDDEKLKEKQDKENAAIQQATDGLNEKAIALNAEADAIRSGASTRETYAADLAFQIEQTKAATMQNGALKDSFLAAAEAQHNAALNQASAKQDVSDVVEAERMAAENKKKADEAANKAQKEYNDLLHKGLEIAQQIGDALAQSGNAGVRTFGNVLQGGVAIQRIATGDVTGGITALISATDLFGTKAKQEAAAVHEAALQLQSAYEATLSTIKRQNAGTDQDPILQNSDQFDALRAQLKQIYTATDGPLKGQILATKEYNDALAALNKTQGDALAKIAATTAATEAANAAEAQRQKVLYDAAVADFNSNLDIRSARASGNTDGADALQRTADHLAEIKQAEDALGVVEDSPYIVHLKQVQAAEDQAADGAKAAAAATAAATEAQRLNRSLFATNNGTTAFTDPRAASEAAFLESLQERIQDATTPMEKLAASTYATAAALDFYTKRLEADTRTSEGFASRVLTALGGGRDAQDITTGFTNRQATVDLANSGASDFNKSFLEFTQQSEQIATAVARTIADQTAQIQAAGADATAKNNKDLADAQAKAANAIKGLEDESKRQSDRFDALVSAAQDQVTYQQQALQAAQSQLALTQKSVDALANVNATLNAGELSTLSPAQKLAESKAQLDALVRAAQGGDRNAAAGVGSAATDYLTQDRNVNGTTAAYGKDFATVQSVVSALQSQYGGLLGQDTNSVNNAQSALTNAQLQVSVLNDLKTATLDDIKSREQVINDATSAYEKSIGDLNAAITTGIDAQIKVATDAAQADGVTRIHELAFYDAFQQFIDGGASLGIQTDSTPLNVTLPTTTDTTLQDQLQAVRDQNKTLGDALKIATQQLGVAQAQIQQQGANTQQLSQQLADLVLAVQENTRSTKQAVLESVQ